MSKIQLYHYTDKRGASGIYKSHVMVGATGKFGKEGSNSNKSLSRTKKLEKWYCSPKNSRRFACVKPQPQGVYFTSIDPNSDPKNILLNNFDDAGRVINSTRLWAKIEWVVEVYLPEKEVGKVVGSNRDVFLFEGDVYLDSYQYQIYKNPYV